MIMMIARQMPDAADGLESLDLATRIMPVMELLGMMGGGGRSDNPPTGHRPLNRQGCVTVTVVKPLFSG